jgi:hypothetical protein
MGNKAAIVGVVLLLAIAGLWFVSIHLHKATLQPAAPVSPQATSTPGSVSGSIEYLNGNEFTLTLSSGDTANIVVTATTTIWIFKGAIESTTTPDQLNIGQHVDVVGTTTEDGSITASTIRVR